MLPACGFLGVGAASVLGVGVGSDAMVCESRGLMWLVINHPGLLCGHRVKRYLMGKWTVMAAVMPDYCPGFPLLGASKKPAGLDKQLPVLLVRGMMLLPWCGFVHAVVSPGRHERMLAWKLLFAVLQNGFLSYFGWRLPEFYSEAPREVRSV